MSYGKSIPRKGEKYIPAKKHVVIFGTGQFAEVVHYYLTEDDRYNVVGFTETEPKGFKFKNLLVTPFSTVDEIFSPKDTLMFVAVGYSNINDTRRQIYNMAKKKGYKLLTYIHHKAIIAKNVTIGENCFIFELNNIQPFVEIGNNVIVWSGNHIGHHTKILDHTFISSHVVISGGCTIGEQCFLGVNSSIIDGLYVFNRCVIGAGAVLIKNATKCGTYVGVPAKRVNRD